MMDKVLDSHEDTATTDYDSGDSGRVGYAYEGGKATVNSKQLTKAASPGRKPKSRSPQGKHRPAPACYACGALQPPLDSDHDIDESTDLEEDTDVEDSVEHRCRLTRRRLSGPSDGSTREEKERGRDRDRSQRSDSKKSAKRSARKRTPYIEEYPEDEAQRPVILLKEHKIPRRSSASDAKSSARNSVEDHKDSGASSRGRSPTGRRLSACVPAQEPTKKRPSTPKRRRSDFQALSGGKFSGSELGSSESESEQPLKALEASPPRRRTLEASPPHRASTEDSHRHPNRGQNKAKDVPPTVARSSAWPQQPQYSSSWPMQSGAQYTASQPQRGHGYGSGDESDGGDNRRFHQHHRRDHTTSGKGQLHPQHQKHQQTTQQQQHYQHQHQQPNTKQQQAHQHQHQPHPANNESSRRSHPLTRERDEAPQVQNPRARQPRPPRPIIARTVVSQRSMATMDRAGTGRDSVAASLCEIWRGRPEDWESPYSSSSEDEYVSGFDDEGVPAMRMIEGSPPRLRPEPSVASFFSRRERDSSTARGRTQRPIEMTSGFLRRSDAAAHMDAAAWERCESPERLPEIDDGLLQMSRRRGISRARSRWTVMEYGGGRDRSPSPAPPVRRWTVDTEVWGRSRSRGPSPVFSARKTRDFLSPKPKRAARFDFDAWGKERGSRSMLALGLGLA